MGAFCVYGISRSVCQAEAERATSAHNITQQEWSARVVKRADERFASGTRPVKVSPEFDAPQFCKDWLRIDPAQVRLARIMVRGGKIDKQGNKVMRNGVQVQTWLQYEVLEVAGEPLPEN